mmetsp:Transcript_16411/g.53604  ORF Transcript_16411/g.53604 Transcript_16411/m.53604 type:complete len:136 (-) Transcript_16411:3-410(-)
MEREDCVREMAPAFLYCFCLGARAEKKGTGTEERILADEEQTEFRREKNRWEKKRRNGGGCCVEFFFGWSGGEETLDDGREQWNGGVVYTTHRREEDIGAGGAERERNAYISACTLMRQRLERNVVKRETHIIKV